MIGMFEGYDIKAALAEFLERAVNPDASEKQRAALTLAFWAGAASAHTCVVNAHCAPDDPEGEKTGDRLEKIGDDINEFAEAQLRRELMTLREMVLAKGPPPDLVPGEARLVKIDSDGNEVPTTAAEQAEVRAMIAHQHATGTLKIKVSDNVRRSMKEHGVTDEMIESMLMSIAGKPH